MYQANFANVVLRLYLMMAVVIVGGFLGWAWMQLLALPVFLLAMFAYKIEWKGAARRQTSMRTEQFGQPSQRLAV